MAKPVPTNAFLQTAKTAAMCTAAQGVSKRREMAKPMPTKAFLQTAKAAAMCTAAQGETKAFLQTAKAAAMCTAARGEPIHLPHPALFASVKPIFKKDCAN